MSNNMGILKNPTKEYFGDTLRKEDVININGLDVEIVSFTDNNGNFHKKGFKPKDGDNLKELLKRMIKVRGDEGDFNDIDTSEIESMMLLFKGNETFNGDITGWNLSEVTDMDYMFWNATSFNKPIGDWKFPNVKTICGMFKGATSFNQDISTWEISGVFVLDNMFRNCPIKEEYKPKME